jgi:bifunctional non-homologous end joining protein LigD
MEGKRKAASKTKQVILPLAGREVVVTNPEKVYFPTAGYTKLDLVNYYVAVADPVLRAIGGRPIVLKRYVNGADEPAFYQKRAPEPRPDWIETVTLNFPSGRTASEVVVRDVAQLAWITNLGNIELHPHPVRTEDLDHPDELRVDLDPGPGVEWNDVRQVALLCREVLGEHDLTAWPKTSGSRGMHLNVRIHPRWGFDDVRRAALALAREVERRAPALATSAWWKEERHGVFIDYNQNAKDRTTAGAYSVRPTPDARVSMPLHWDEVPTCDPAAFNLKTAPERLAAEGDAAAGMDGAAGALDRLLELSDRQAAAGATDAPWPPHYEKKEGEPARVRPSARKGASKRNADPTRLITVARAARKEDALAALERWKERHPEVAARLALAEVLVDTMRGASSTWTRVRIDLKNIPAEERPAQEEKLETDYDPFAAWRGTEREREWKEREEARREARGRKRKPEQGT